ncbi:hypothetical protein IT400_00975 [Candidatus Nomurabacteria bacterium]|nr:hypothetical protein [Candidatus Nomurabacteria bacterium]
MRIIDKESNSGKIIYALGMGIGITVALANRRTSYKTTKLLINKVFGLNKRPKNLNRCFYQMRKLKLIKIEKIGDDNKVILTENGQKIFLRFNYENLQLNENKIWDRNFRMILFDIPEKNKRARDAFRLKMKELGCVKFNDSVWVYPYPCQTEIDFIANYWNVGKYVHFAIVKEITNKENLEKYFNL